jgi:hypothetical protein
MKRFFRICNIYTYEIYTNILLINLFGTIFAAEKTFTVASMSNTQVAEASMNWRDK